MSHDGERASGAGEADSLLNADPVRIAHFSLHGRLGSGGMGVVYRAYDELLRRDVALKLLPAGHASDPQRHKRFLREARIAASLVHPNIAGVHEVGESSGCVYIAMELIEGVTLRTALEGGALPMATVRVLALEMAQGLAAAHAKGIVHRDLKPENVMISRSGVAKLLDFGLAIGGSATSDDGFADAKTETQITREGTVIGTTAYMSPEQVLGMTLDPRSDVFAFGIVLYEMMEGRRPFGGATLGDVRSAIAREAPAPLSEPARGAGGELERVVRRCLSKSPEQRFADAVAIVRALQSFDDEGVPVDSDNGLLAGKSARPVTMSAGPAAHSEPRKGLPIALGVSLAAFAALAFVVHLRRERAADPPIGSMVRFSGAAFPMGRTQEELDVECKLLGADCRADALARELPRHEVRVAPFYLDVNEATNAELAVWLNSRRIDVVPDPDPGAESRDRRFVEDSATHQLLVDLDPELSGLEPGPGETVLVRAGFERVPVIQITWDAARMYCASTGKRLPTEAEWELAARGESNRRFPWGEEDLPCPDAVIARDDGLRCAGEAHRPISIDAPSRDWSPEGVHDLGGNVSEWIEDAFLAPRYLDCGDCVNPVVEPPHPDPNAENRIFRGGGWANSIFSHASARGRWARASLSQSLGVRCALSANR